MVKVKVAFGLIAFAPMTGCGQKEKYTSSLTQVIGTDTRSAAPLQYAETIGTLNFGEFHICSAFVSAPNVISTANHCSPMEDALDNYSFLTQSGKRFKLKKKLNTNPKNLSSFETVESAGLFLEAAQFARGIPLETVSYSATKKRYMRATALQAQLTTQGILHQLDTEPGSSGAPILQNGKVVAVHEGAIANSKNNYARLVLSESTQADNYLGLIDQEWKCNSQCEWYQPDCYAWKEFNCNTGIITICRRNLTVPMIAYYACQASLSALPATCTAAAVLTAGTSCYANIGIAAAACSVSIDQIYEIGKACSSNL